MKTYENNPPSAAIRLRQLIDEQLNHVRPLAEKNNSEVLNEIDGKILLQGVNSKMTDLLYQVLYAVISNSKYGDIHIRSERYKDHVDLCITDRSNYNGYSLSFSIGSIVPDASRLGADLLLMNYRQKEATVVFSIPGSFAA